MNALYVSLAVIGGLMLMLGMLGGLLIERTLISEPLIALLAGVLIGPDVFGGQGRSCRTGETTQR